MAILLIVSLTMVLGVVAFCVGMVFIIENANAYRIEEGIILVVTGFILIMAATYIVDFIT